MKLKLISVLIIIISLTACKTKKQTIADPMENIISAITDAVHLLENKEY